MTNATTNIELVAIFTETGFILDVDSTKNKNPYINDRLLTGFNEDPYKALLYFGFEGKAPNMSPSLMYIHGISSLFVQNLSKNPDLEITRSAKEMTEDESALLLQNMPYAIGSEFVTGSWLKNLWGNLAKALKSELAGFEGSASEYLLTHNSSINIVGRVFFHLVENLSSDEYPFAFLATYSKKSKNNKKAQHVPLKEALLEHKGNQDKLLQLLGAVSRAADVSNFISELVESGEIFSPLQFTADEAYIFLREIPIYEQCGIMCRMPDWWKKKYNTIRVSVSIGDKPPSRFGLDALLSFTPALLIDGVELSREELERLISQTSGLSLLKGKWIEVDHEKLREVLEAFDGIRNNDSEITFSKAMRMQMGLAALDDSLDDDAIEISNGEWLRSVMDSIKKQGKRRSIKNPKSFKAALRQYQQDGLDWLATMRSLGFGALLADDMGLGKTVQLLALLEYLRTAGDLKALLIIPASLIGNWQKEISRFTPDLRHQVLHSKNTEIDLTGTDLFITTYGMASRIEELNNHIWDVLILDEAQAIKNPGTKQTKAVKSIPSKHCIAMTGTPVENRLSDLWSLFDFLNKGLLGTSKEFSAYAKNVISNESYARIRHVISPFILRRLKTDKSIISDLPDKFENKAYATLSKKQTVLYTALVNELKVSLETLDGIQRKGVVLASIMKFKQICNHPDQYLGQNAFEHTHSGKFSLLNELCETIREKRERVLVFTQFREMCDPLSEYLETLFGKRGLMLHGQTPVKKRAQLVEEFNGDKYVPYMILSLKAGGVGLNLTAANHVIHFDRWWNPAVENQATDRAFRIGQKKNVLVHKIITQGTIEDKIDQMIEEKQKLSNDLIAKSGENWITEMSSNELLDLFALEA
jgi:non-specific serine/threonine protein kinase